jgi:hypothetical protein
MGAAQPEDLDRLFLERANAGDVDGVVALYEPDAVLAFPPGQFTVGTAAIRAVYADLLASRPKFAALGQPGRHITPSRHATPSSSPVPAWCDRPREPRLHLQLARAVRTYRREPPPPHQPQPSWSGGRRRAGAGRRPGAVAVANDMGARSAVVRTTADRAPMSLGRPGWAGMGRDGPGWAGMGGRVGGGGARADVIVTGCQRILLRVGHDH